MGATRQDGKREEQGAQFTFHGDLSGASLAYPFAARYLLACELRVGRGAATPCDESNPVAPHRQWGSGRPQPVVRLWPYLRPDARFGVPDMRFLLSICAGRGVAADIQHSSSGCAPPRSSYTVAAGRRTVRTSRHSRHTSAADCLSSPAAVPAGTRLPLFGAFGRGQVLEV
jgi:hypothetical protein